MVREKERESGRKYYIQINVCFVARLIKYYTRFIVASLSLSLSLLFSLCYVPLLLIFSYAVALLCSCSVVCLYIANSPTILV